MITNNQSENENEKTIQVHNSLANVKIKENTHVYFLFNSLVKVS